MATASFDQIMRKAQSAWKKYKDKAVGKEERETIKKVTDKFLKKHGCYMDWKTGMVMDEASWQQEQEAQQAGTKKKASTKKKVKQGMSTNDLIAFIREVYQDEWTGKNLRRRIRQMDKWNDGKMTHYDFTKSDVIEILEHIGYDTKEAEEKLA